ncbi:MAG: tetratricopeptide repeat protein [Planctomycetota bacterium]|nr:tetratricopeptide repeat protein [Planctomycetota bacterium]
MKTAKYLWLLASPFAVACVSVEPVANESVGYEAQATSEGLAEEVPMEPAAPAEVQEAETPIIAEANTSPAAEVLEAVQDTTNAVMPETESLEATGPQNPGMSPEVAQLSVWSDPRYTEQFQASFLALSQVEPSLTMDEREVMQKVMEDLGKGKMERAIGRLERDGGPQASAVFDFTRANLYFQADDLENAKAHYMIAVEKFPKFQRAWKNLGLIHVRDGKMREAGDAFSRVIQLGGRDAVTYGLLGFAHTSAGHAIAAESAYRLAIMLDPYTLDWKIGLARSFFKQRRFAEAAAQCGSLIEQFPERGDLWLLQANAFIGLNDTQGAAENLAMADRLGTSSFESLANLGDIYINSDLFDLAVTAHVRALSIGSSVQITRAMRAAKILIAKGELDETLRLVQAIEGAAEGEISTEDSKDLLKLQARVAVATGEAEEELRVLKSIVELDPLDGEALILIGQSYARNGDSQQAIFYFERAEGIESTEADARVRHAQLLVKEGRYSEALPLLRRAQSIQPREDIRKYMEQIERIVRKG